MALARFMTRLSPLIDIKPMPLEHNAVRAKVVFVVTKFPWLP